MTSLAQPPPSPLRLPPPTMTYSRRRLLLPLPLPREEGRRVAQRRDHPSQPAVRRLPVPLSLTMSSLVPPPHPLSLSLRRPGRRRRARVLISGVAIAQVSLMVFSVVEREQVEEEEEEEEEVMTICLVSVVARLQRSRRSMTSFKTKNEQVRLCILSSFLSFTLSLSLSLPLPPYMTPCNFFIFASNLTSSFVTSDRKCFCRASMDLREMWDCRALLASK